nr:hypothetical protein CFP56_00375 [Quercus suber]
MLGITPLQAFAAGAALCSTSLGTTFTVLSTSGLTKSRLGVILTSAAMMDDVIGLVMVQVISTLGQTSAIFDAVTVVRPICVSVAFAIIIPLLCKFIVKPLTVWWYRCRFAANSSLMGLNARHAMFMLHTGVVVAFVTGSTYAGTSNLFAAYLAGACITWWDRVCAELPTTLHDTAGPAPPDGDGNSKQPQSAPATNPPTTILEHVPFSGFSGIQLYERYYGPLVSAILKPFFFASIGFSIPITSMFSSHVIWRGIVYAALMVFAKLICGLCLVRFGSFGVDLRPLKRLVAINWRICGPRSKAEPPVQPTTFPPKTSTTTGTDAGPSVQSKSDSPDERQSRWTIPKPLSLYPAAILGSAMVARGEIGFLISSVAESNGVYGDEPNELFLVVTWAILLCTLFGPITVGMLVRRVKVLQGNATGGSEYAGREDPLGVWGIVDSSPSQTEQATAIEQE